MFQIPFGNNRKRGVTVVEIMVALFVFGVALSALFALVGYGVRNASLLQQTNQAVSLALEAMEAVRTIRDTTDWNVDGLGTFSTGQAYHPEIQGASLEWRLVSGAETISGFRRELVLNTAQRDASDNIVPSGGSPDPNTKKVTVTVSWQERGASRDVQLTTYLTNWR